MSERGWCEWCEGRCQSVDGSGVRGDVRAWMGAV